MKPHHRPWSHNYIDIVCRYFWNPSYIDLKSVKIDKNQREYLIQQELISVGQDLIYIRANGAIRTTINRIHTGEEPLNDVLNIFLGIAPDSILSSLFFEPLEFTESGTIQSIGREVADRFRFGMSNVTQPDGFLHSERSAVFLEIKTGSRSSANQLLKYLALAVLEEQTSGRKEQLGLLFITPESEGARFWPQLGLRGPEIPHGYLTAADRSKLNSQVSHILETSGDHIESVASRITLAHLSWKDLVNRIDDHVAAANQQGPGGQTTARLLAGLRHSIVFHKGTKAGYLAP